MEELLIEIDLMENLRAAQVNERRARVESDISGQNVSRMSANTSFSDRAFRMKPIVERNSRKSTSNQQKNHEPESGSNASSIISSQESDSSRPLTATDLVSCVTL